jgi:hypothetical protein
MSIEISGDDEERSAAGRDGSLSGLRRLPGIR